MRQRIASPVTDTRIITRDPAADLDQFHPVYWNEMYFPARTG
jgi:hypothetical protein